jgi:hypothetical protein
MVVKQKKKCAKEALITWQRSTSFNAYFNQASSHSAQINPLLKPSPATAQAPPSRTH